jgi:hypothetical protein
LLGQLVLLAQASRGEKLPPPTRAAVMMALLGIALLGMLIVVIILLGGHWVRRQGNFRRGRSVPPDRAPILTPPESDLPTESAEVSGDTNTTSASETIITHDALRDKDEPS